MRLLWLDDAETDLEAIVEYLSERNPEAALQARDAVRQLVGLLADQPALGRPGRVAGTRELVIARTPYIVAYSVDVRSDTVIILRVLHGARRWPKNLN